MKSRISRGSTRGKGERVLVSRERGLTLVEIMVATAVAGLVGAGLLVVVSMGVTLYAQNFSINQSHHALRRAHDQLHTELSRARALAVLTDETGQAVGGSGPAAGIRFTAIDAGPYFLNNTANSNVSQFTVRNRSPRLRAGMLLLLENPVAAIPITQVTPAGSSTNTPSTLNVRFANNLGTYLQPPVLTPEIVYRRNTPIYVGREVAFRAVPIGDGRAELRYYDSDEDSFRVLCRLFDGGDPDNLLPFSLTGGVGQQQLQIALNVQSRRYSNRVDSFYSYVQSETRARLR